MKNFPKQDIELKNRIRMNSYDILELAYQANTISDIIEKKRLLNQMIAKSLRPLASKKLWLYLLLVE